MITLVRNPLAVCRNGLTFDTIMPQLGWCAESCMAANYVNRQMQHIANILTREPANMHLI